LTEQKGSNTYHQPNRHRANVTALLHALTGVGSVVSPRVRSGNRSGNPGGVDSELTHSETSSNYLCTNDGLETGRLTSGGCGDSSAEREFPSDKVYRRDDRGVVGVESFGLQCSAFVVIDTSVGRKARSCGSGTRNARIG